MEASIPSVGTRNCFFPSARSAGLLDRAIALSMATLHRGALPVPCSSLVLLGRWAVSGMGSSVRPASTWGHVRPGGAACSAASARARPRERSGREGGGGVGDRQGQAEANPAAGSPIIKRVMAREKG